MVQVRVDYLGYPLTCPQWPKYLGPVARWREHRDCVVDPFVSASTSMIEVERKLVQSMIGMESKTLSANGLLPKGERIVVGENTALHLQPLDDNHLRAEKDQIGGISQQSSPKSS